VIACLCGTHNSEQKSKRLPITNYLLPIPMTPSEFEYLIRKTVVYLEFHSDDSAKELSAAWQDVLTQIQQYKKQKKSTKNKLNS
jgi:hypothetical protein